MRFANPEKDFPREIEYRLDPATGQLTITASGVDPKGEESAFAITLRRR
jgi:hypothetical protein